MDSIVDIKTKNYKARLSRYYRLVSWVPQKDRLIKAFERLDGNSEFIDALYCSYDGEHRHIQLHSGAHFIGTKLNSKPVKESGAAIVITQLSTGEVSVTFYPFVSEVLSPGEEYLVWSILESPNELYPAKIQKIIEDFFAYSRFTSSCMNESFMDRIAVKTMQWKSKRYRQSSRLTNALLDNWLLAMVGFIGSICSIVSVL
ncbi:hypothetical protein RB985_004868 [Vibrio alginolyticus]|nr:hypothetical protein [Vibrio alginolyticus]ELA8378659.1 hypothetical protein [Vibrio alginolyticus]